MHASRATVALATQCAGAVLALSALVALLVGCGHGEEPPNKGETGAGMSQEEQLESYIHTADSWGVEIAAQIDADEIAPDSEPSNNYGGVRKASDYGVEWPKYYYWAAIIVLREDGPRTPTAVADDLDPWLEAQGWERAEEREFPPGRDSFERDYFRDGYHLVVEVYTVPPPHAQKLQLMIVTPETDRDAD